MDPASLLPLLKIYREAFETRDEEHMWYHFWSEVFMHLNQQTRTEKQSLSVAPQRRYTSATRKAVQSSRDQPILTRSQTLPDSAHEEIPDEEDDPMADVSFGSGLTAEFVHLDEITRYRTPDFSIFQYLFLSNSLKPRAIGENKPLESLQEDAHLYLSPEDIRKKDVKAIVREWENCRTQVCEQLACFFADFDVPEIALFTIIGGRYSMYMVTKDNFEDILHAVSGEEMEFVFDDYFQPTTLNPRLTEIWNLLSATN